MHSPDPLYVKKRDMNQAVKLAKEKPEEYVALFEDEATFYRQPSQGWLWSYRGRRQPKMHYSHHSNTRMRVVGFLNGCNRAVHSMDMPKVSARNLAQCIKKVPQLYPDARKIFLIWDNWPVHEHPNVQKVIQTCKRIQIVPLPTYAPWLNAVEKLWRWTKQRVTHAHPWSNDFVVFRQHVRQEFASLSNGSQELLHYVGLST